jgi:hypothetical protein
VGFPDPLPGSKLGGTGFGGSPNDFDKLAVQEIEKWSKVIDVADKRTHCDLQLSLCFGRSVTEEPNI